MFEAGRVMTSTMAVERMLIYWIKLKMSQKTLQRAAMAIQESRSDREQNWITGVRRVIQEYELNDLIDENNIGKYLINKVKKKCREMGYLRMKSAVMM